MIVTVNMFFNDITNQYKSIQIISIISNIQKKKLRHFLEGTWMNRGWGTFGGYSGNPSLLSISCTKCMVLRLVPGRVWEGRPGVLLSQPFLGEKKGTLTRHLPMWAPSGGSGMRVWALQSSPVAAGLACQSGQNWVASNLLCVSIIQVSSFHLSNNEIVYEIKKKWGLIMQIGLCTAIKWVLPRIGVPQNGWLIIENPFKMDDLGGPPLFLETPK